MGLTDEFLLTDTKRLLGMYWEGYRANALVKRELKEKGLAIADALLTIVADPQGADKLSAVEVIVEIAGEHHEERKAEELMRAVKTFLKTKKPKKKDGQQEERFRNLRRRFESVAATMPGEWTLDVKKLKGKGGKGKRAKKKETRAANNAQRLGR